MTIVHNVQVHPIYAGHVNDHKVLLEREFACYEHAMEYVKFFNDSGNAIDSVIAVYTGAINTMTGENILV